MTALIRRDDSALSVSWTAEAQQLKEEALQIAACVAVVSNPAQQAAAVEAQVSLKSLINDCEKARKECKEPVLEFGRRIDDAARVFKKELESELMRLGSAVGDFVQLEEAKRKAAEAARLKELQDIERQRQQELAAAQSHDQLDAVQDKFNRIAAEVPPVIPVRAERQIVREDWDITVTDIWLLARAHPGCVKIEPRLSEIKELLKSGVDVKGVTAKKILNSTVRVPSRQHTLALDGGAA